MESMGLIRQFLKDRPGVDTESMLPDAVLADLGVDSLMMLELMFEFEDHFGVTLSKDLKTPKTVRELVALMDQLRMDQQRNKQN